MESWENAQKSGVQEAHGPVCRQPLRAPLRGQRVCLSATLEGPCHHRECASAQVDSSGHTEPWAPEGPPLFSSLPTQETLTWASPLANPSPLPRPSYRPHGAHSSSPTRPLPQGSVLG